MALDLEEGDEELAEATPAQRRRAARRAAGDNASSTKKPAPSRSKVAMSDRVDAEIASRLDRTFDRIAKALEARDDAEFADVIREDSAAMSQGVVSLTRSVVFLRGPLLMFLNLVEPALAFGRVGRLIYTRFAERQQRISYERQQQQEQQAGEMIASVATP